ncbi:hypothetical protein K1718_26060 [Roseibium porphyridii]|uniref:Uncharacterized protein n=1 Tax=Roseibium porphyridii TaxID=2866279 RepID=A0ABY8F261_9HYPH|nr:MULTISPECIES: hypothetical protein [Stappiaceae]QFT34609.1 hypothetical protein FIV00_29205 [Labrenzia sp. THAF82]WFE89576.1 hypothetical protein K1718_26060 [Roseibium sp. KMA01]
MPISDLKKRGIKTISIVGNGPVSKADADMIDKADFVLRFNSAPACGAAGERVDALLLNRARVYMSKRINPVALHRAPEVWVNDIRENGDVDWLFTKECKQSHLGFGPITKARGHLKEFDPFERSNPTTGASIIAEILDVMPEVEIHLFGFTHQGKQHTHDWDAEKLWVDRLCDEGRIRRYLTSGPQVSRSLKGRVEYAFRFLEKRSKHYIYNKLLHSSSSTKKRIFGQDA